MAKSDKRQSVRKKPSRHWRRVDLHIHTPASSDYQEPNITYLDILRQAEVRGLDAIAFTDHNTISGYAAMRLEIDELELLERLGGITCMSRWEIFSIFKSANVSLA